jgi:Na+-driven multidrug efflux pump
MKKLIIWDYILQGASNVLIMIFARQLIGLYSSLSPETEQLAWILIMLHSGFAVLMWPPALALPSALRAANDVKFTMWVSVAAMVFARIGLSWLLGVHFGMGVIGVWIGMIMDWVVRIVFFVPRVLSGKWQTKYKPS